MELGPLGAPLPIRHDSNLPSFPEVIRILSLLSLPVMRAEQVKRGYRTPAEIMAEAMLLDGWEEASQYSEEEFREAVMEYLFRKK